MLVHRCRTIIEIGSGEQMILDAFSFCGHPICGSSLAA